MSAQQLDEQREFFESLTLSEAQWTVRFGKMATKDKGPS